MLTELRSALLAFSRWAVLEPSSEFGILVVAIIGSLAHRSNRQADYIELPA
jgi:hypothetical protein